MGWGGLVWGWGVQGGCEWRSEAFVKIQKKKIFFWGGGVGGRVRGGRVGGSGWMGMEKCSLCENSKKKLGGGGVRGVGGGPGWVAVNGDEAFVKIQKKKKLGGGGVGWGGGGGRIGGVRVDGNREVKLL